MKYWINVISKDHVLRGVREGITQSGHGKLAPLKRMHQGDWILFYSPKQSLSGNEKLQAFTALGQVADEEIFQFEMSPDFHPYRRRVNFSQIQEVPILPLIEQLEFIEDKKHWGYKFKFGLFEIGEKDFLMIEKLMRKTKDFRP